MDFWGDLPSWITALIAGVAAWFGLRQYRKDLAENAIRHERERKAQPARLGIWWAHHIAAGQYQTLEEATQKSNSSPTESAEKINRDRGLVISNSANIIFHNLVIKTTFDGRELLPVRIHSLPPGSYFTPFRQKEERCWGWTQSTEVLPGNFTALTEARKYQIDSVTFTDGLGQRWKTDGHGTLSLLEEEIPPGAGA
ncbi:hypothetical protein [Psychromicrobium sp. YIM B11713]|uniref:hypothetical protein n=1 Tax=Psychromicrobium sp. YIM B11713 TaxID=3145233 RepID=UPI00374FCF97